MTNETARCLFRVTSDQALAQRRFSLAAGRHEIGADAACPVHLPVAGVSRRHASVEVFEDGGFVIEDQGSRNGTSVEGRRIRRKAAHGALDIALGPVHVTIENLEPERSDIAIAATGGARPEDRQDHERPLSTQSLSVEERLAVALAAAAASHRPTAIADQEPGSQVGGGRAIALAQRLLGEMDLDRVELGWTRSRGGGRVAALGEPLDRLGAADAQLEDGDGRQLSLWGRDAPRLLAARRWLLVALVIALPSAAFACGSPAPIAPEPPATGSPKMRALYRTAARVARGEIPILIRGASGTGKEVLARYIHLASNRAELPFLALNCAALPRQLLEAELFGIERGVATGVDARAGLIEQAEGGTLLLDEIGDMEPATQAKVLRVLQERSLLRVGGRRAKAVDVRILAATHRDLEAMIADGGFRLDLYHRLAGAVLELPALTDRPEDVPLLASRFFDRALAERIGASPGMTRAALECLLGHTWPGNVRELENEMTRAVLLLDPGEPLDIHHLSPAVRGASPEAGDATLGLDHAVRAAERTALTTALAASAGEHPRAIALLGISRATFYRKLKEHDIADA